MIDKSHLQNIFSRPFDAAEWSSVLQKIFGVRQLLTSPRRIPLPVTDKARDAWELGSFTTSDARIVGFYQVEVSPNVWLERNKVGLRELMRSVYRYDVDGALIVFVQEGKWRLSFISEIKVLNEEGEVVQQTTESKRYTYLLGEDEKVLTPATRLSKLAGKPLSLEDIRAAFSVDALNEEFYKIVQEQFYQLVGGALGEGKKLRHYERQLILPYTPADAQKVYAEFAVRLIGRIVFSWFLKVKKSEAGMSLLPEHLLSLKAVKDTPLYYHRILEPLFFQTLNTPVTERIVGLPEGCAQVPFLNGGLFEPHGDDFYRPNHLTGLSENINTLVIPDAWFLALFEELEKYHFTIDENSVTDVEVSVDPEMLGRIFENLLAEIDPDSGETARKSTGSFYTPREIVDYMATESLVQYLYNQTAIEPEHLRPIFKMIEGEQPIFKEHETENILGALDRIKVLDPACGSGAFPMGVLQKIVMALQKLDPEATWWKNQQIQKFESAVTNPVLRRDFKRKMQTASVEYARKIGIIQNSLYGVDIQPIAAEISKLRCFLTLIVDENINESQPNRGVEPLPNLEFKFVTADTLLKLPEEKDLGGLFNANDDLDALKKIRIDYLQCYGEQKETLKKEFEVIRNKIVDQQIRLGTVDVKSRAFKISRWNPFRHEKADWFDPEWMYGVKDFDVVIGNPPYVLLQNTSLSIEQQNYLRKIYFSAQYKTDLFHLFIEKGILLTKPTGGVLTYITPNTFLKNKHNNKLREFITSNTHLVEIVRFFVPIFANASVDNSILICSRVTDIPDRMIYVKDINHKHFNELYEAPILQIFQKSIIPESFSFDFDLFGNNILPIISRHQPLGKYGRTYFGIQTFDRSRFVSKKCIDENYKPVVDGVNVTRYMLKNPVEYVYFKPDAIKSGGNKTVYEKERLLVRQIGKFPEACFCPSGIFTLNTIYNIYLNEDSRINLKYLLGLINSSVIRYYWIKTYSDSKKTFPKIKKSPLESIPIAYVNSNIQNIFSIIVDYLLYIYYMIYMKSADINLQVPNAHIATLFEDVIDAMVMELYFSEDLQKAEIEFIKYVGRDFSPIEHLETKEEKITVIQAAYQKLREKDNEIRNNLKLMDIKLANLVMPIKTSR